MDALIAEAPVVVEATERDSLRLITCGSVDDGKSTLLGRLLNDAGLLPDDALAALARDSRAHGTQGDALDFALLFDGLAAEREQGITIDVAWRYFSTPARSFVVGDCPGHEQYTRNMATGASNAELAIVLVDAEKGLRTQTRRHSFIVALFGIRRVVLAVNKMDRIGFDRARFDAIVDQYRTLATQFGIAEVQAIPVSALHGDNLVNRSSQTPWYEGPTLLAHLEAAPSAALPDLPGFALPVQWVNRPNADFRGYCGTLAAGTVRRGQPLLVLPSMTRSRVERIFVGDRETDQASAGDAVTVTLADERDISRGDLLCDIDHPIATADQFHARLLWLAPEPMLPGRRLLVRIGTRTVGAQITEIRHRIDVNTQEALAAKRLELNELAVVNLSLEDEVAYAPFEQLPELGSFIVIDRQNNNTVGAGVIDYALRRAANLHWQQLEIDRAARAAALQQTPCCLWFTGLSGSGKSTIANLVEKRLHAMGRHTYLLDGDNVRHGLNRDLGFTAEDRVENIRRVAEVARLMVDAGLIVLVSFISPYRSERRMARDLFAPGEFVEVFVDTPLEVCEARDPKQLYRKARAGQIPNFTGISAPYEVPEAPELRIATVETSPEQAVSAVIARLP